MKKVAAFQTFSSSMGRVNRARWPFRWGIRTLLLILPVLIACLLPRRASAEEEVPAHFPIERTLPNGLRVVVEEDHRLPLVGMYMLYGVGSGDDPDGLAYVVPRLMVRATKHVPRGDYDRLLDQAGARGKSWGFGTDRTYFSVTVPSSRVALPLWLWSDQMGYLDDAVDGTALDEARQQIQNDRSSRVDTRPLGALEDLVRKELFPEKHPYRNATIGAPASMANVTVDDAKRFHADAYGPDNAVLVIVGDVKFAPTFALVERYFGTLKRGRGFTPPGGVARQLPHGVKLLVATSVDHGLVSLDWPLPSAREPDSRMQTLADVLFGLDIRELEWCLGRRGISTRATAAYTFRERGSSLRLTAEVPKGRKPQEVIEAIDDALRELGAGVREESVRGAVAAVARSHTSAFELLGARADRLAFAMARTGRASRAYADPVEPSPAELARLFAALQHMPRVVTIFQVDPAASLAGDLRERRGVAGVP